MEFWKDWLKQDSEFQSLNAGIAMGLKEMMVTGISGSARHLYMGGLISARRGTVVVITASMSTAQQAVDDLTELLPDHTVLLFPEREMSFLDILAYSPEQAASRLKVLERLAAGEPTIVVAPIASVYQPITPVDQFRDASLSIKVGQQVEMSTLIEHLVYLGYERVDLVETKGEFTVRGGIIDFYPLTTSEAVRIEFFDDEVDSIRSFDVQTQRSLEKLTEFTLWPIREMIAKQNQFHAAGVQVESALRAQLARKNDDEYKTKLQQHVGVDLEKLQQGIFFPGLLRYGKWLYENMATLLSYSGEGALLFIDEPTRLREVARVLEREAIDGETQALERGEVLADMLPRFEWLSFLTDRQYVRMMWSLFPRQVPGTMPQRIINIQTRQMQSFHGQMPLLKSELDRYRRTGYRIVFLAADEHRAERLKRVLEDFGMEAEFTHDPAALSNRPAILQGNLHNGFELSLLRLAVITETEVFTTKQRKIRPNRSISDAERIKSYQELKIGDYVVHLNHGIGKYIGITTLVVENTHRDYLQLEYANGDSLYVPTDQIDMVQKYVGAEEKAPKIYSLNGSEWQRVKSKVQSSVQDIAQDLIKLYAARQAAPGYAFAADTAWQREFEAMFPYEETPDQLKSITEIKRDMEEPRPMDRLLCGDVGYGKTEVAIRAAFKSVMDGKQVAVLVPTTILAQQHYQTFTERCAGFPVRIEVLSRFRTKAQCNEVIKGVRDGSVDIVIGTHRLLNKSVQFKDLGLLVVDEEQRFGVTHKEKIKQLKNNVDSLTLTATPIPRTLHMSMLGIRDLSVIETPPENRFPIQTYVVEYSDGLVREAIERELGRGGQVYFLFNKVREIDRMAERIRSLVPDARVSVGHGQMSEEELERVMLEFLEGEADVLVSTTIIETGIDIPNVNTLIVNDADHMGLSQLYQLRGRVGRSNRVAYAFFTYQRDKVLTEVAEKRLQAIKEFTELGSGFKIAMRDLSIRGAGNLLGAEQHGFIASVGFDLYSQMLTETIQELKGEVKEKTVEPSVELGVDAYIPEVFIPDPVQKIEIYKKFVSAKTLEQVTDLEEEIEDRFGELPTEVRQLLAIVRIKLYALRYGFDSIGRQGHDVSLKLHEKENARIQGDKLFALSKKFPNRMNLTAGKNIVITLRVKGLSSIESLALLEQFMEEFASVRKEDALIGQTS